MCKKPTVLVICGQPMSREKWQSHQKSFADNANKTKEEQRNPQCIIPDKSIEVLFHHHLMDPKKQLSSKVSRADIICFQGCKPGTAKKISGCVKGKILCAKVEECIDGLEPIESWSKDDILQLQN